MVDCRLMVAVSCLPRTQQPYASSCYLLEALSRYCGAASDLLGIVPSKSRFSRVAAWECRAVKSVGFNRVSDERGVMIVTTPVFHAVGKATHPPYQPPHTHDLCLWTRSLEPGPASRIRMGNSIQESREGKDPGKRYHSARVSTSSSPMVGLKVYEGASN